MSIVLDVSIKALYVQGSVPAVDAATTDQLRAVAAELHITTIAGSAAALAELRRTPGWQALLASPSLPQNEILALITSLRRDRIPIAIVPIVEDSHQDLFASAVASGADDVLVRRGEALVNVPETLARIRQSPHLFPAEQRRRISVLYAGRDPLVWNLLDQVPFVKAERVVCGVDGACPVRRSGSGDDSMRADAVIIDEQPGDAHPLQVLKSVKAQASDLPVIVLTSAGAADIATAALELGADDTVLKTGIFRRRLIATLRRVHQRLELTAQQTETRTREERLRQIVENVPTGIIVVAAGGNVLAMNAAALQLFGASRPRDVVGRDFRQLVAPADQDAITDLIRRVTHGEAASITFDALAIGGSPVRARLDAVVLERDARGGRGVVASVTRAEDTESDTRSAELGALQASLQTMERHYAELEDARNREQAAWEAERLRLEARLQEAERLAAERTSLSARLDEVTAELNRTNETFTAEREALERRMAELEAAARDATALGATRAELERALDAVREEQQQAIAAHALERSGWQDIRSELEARVRDLGTTQETEHASALSALRAEVLELQQTLAAERERWTTTRDELEAELRNAREALWTEHNERDASKAEAEASLARLREELESDRTAWLDAKATLEHALADARAAREAVDLARDREREERDRQIEERLQQLQAGFEAERAEWQQRRSALEGDLRRAQDAEGAQRELTAVRSRLEAELEELRQELSLERNAADAVERRAREEIERAEEATRSITDEYDATRVRLERERDDARETHAAALQAWTDARTRLDQALLDASNQAQLIQQRWEAEREARSAEHARALADARAEWDAERNALAAEVEATRHDRDDARQALDEARGRVDAITVELEDVRRLAGSHDAVVAELDAARRERDAAQHERDQAWQELESLRHDHGEAERQREALQRTHDDVRQQYEALQHERDEVNRQQEALKRERDAACQRHEALQQERDDVGRQLDETRARLESIGPELDDLRQRASDRDMLAGELESARAERDAAQHERDEARRQQDDLQRERDEVRQRHEGLQQERDDVGRQLDETRARLDALGRELDDLRQRASDRDILAGELESVRTERDAAQHERDEARRQQEDLQRERDEVRQRHEALQQERDAVGRQLDETRARLDALGRELDDLRQRASDRDTLATALDAAREEIRHTDAAHRAEREEWERSRQLLARELDEAITSRDADRDDWARARSVLESDARDAARLARERQAAEEALSSLRADYAALAESLAAERTQQGRIHQEADALRATLADTERRQADFDAALARASRSADAQLARQAALYDARIRDLEVELREASDRIAQVTGTAEATRAELRAGYTRAWESHARLVATDVFGYAVTTLAGDLVRCNDAFARMFGFVNGAEALARSAGRPFAPLANRPAIAARLAADGRIDRVESCVDRIDGRAIRILESAVVTGSADRPDARMVEHVIVARQAAPSAEEVQARRLQEVGALAAAMMPELETLVAAVDERSAALARQTDGRVPPTADLDDLHATAARTAALVGQLAGFSRRQNRTLAPLDLGEAVLTAEPILARLAGDGVSFSAERRPTTPLHAHPGDIDHLLTSLVTLGRDALPTGGSIVVRAEQQAGGTTPGDTPFAMPGPLLSVAASGYGAQAPGTLAAVELVARRCGGHVRVEGEPGRVVRFEVIFPRCT